MLILDGMAAGFLVACARIPAEHFSISMSFYSHANVYVQVIFAHPISRCVLCTRRRCSCS